MAVPGSEPSGRLLDVYIEGEPLRRRAAVEVGPDALEVNGRILPFRSIYWMARRAGLLLLFGETFTAALKGRRRELEELARAVEQGGARSDRRRRVLLRPFAPEVVVCTAGVAVRGTLAGEEVSGLHLAVFTQRALHLLVRGRWLSLPWPVDRARRERPAGSEATHETLVLRKEGSSLRLRYLFPEEIRAALRVATRLPGPTEEETPAGALELFARGEVAPPVPPRLPDFRLTVEEVRRESAAQAARIPDGAREGAGLPGAFFQTHFRELGEIVLGPLLARRSAAAAAASLHATLEVLDAGELRADTDAAVAASAARLAEAFEAEARRVLHGAGGRRRRRVVPRLTEAERDALTSRLRQPLTALSPLFSRLESCQESLLQGLEAYEGGPPEGMGEALEGAGEEWRAALARLDGAFGNLWKRLLGEVSDTWREVLIPRLVSARSTPRRRMTDATRLVVFAGAVLLAVGLLLLFF